MGFQEWYLPMFKVTLSISVGNVWVTQLEEQPSILSKHGLLQSLYSLCANDSRFVVRFLVELWTRNKENKIEPTTFH